MVEHKVIDAGYNLMVSIFSILSEKFKNIADYIHFEQFKLKFGEKDSDIYIVTYPKSGTTLMQMILYQLTTSGKMDFNHIYDVSPWIRNASIRRQDVKYIPSPRIIKTHDPYHKFEKSKKGKFIFVYRNGMDTAVSMYNQTLNYIDNNVEFDSFVKEFLKPQKNNWFDFNASWVKNKNKFPILYVKYENLITNKEKEIFRIIDFCNLVFNDEVIQRTISRSSFDFMKRNEAKFGIQPKEKNKVYNQFIRKGLIGEGSLKFSEKQKYLFKKELDRSINEQLISF